MNDVSNWTDDQLIDWMVREELRWIEAHKRFDQFNSLAIPGRTYNQKSLENAVWQEICTRNLHTRVNVLIQDHKARNQAKVNGWPYIRLQDAWLTSVEWGKFQEQFDKLVDRYSQTGNA